MAKSKSPRKDEPKSELTTKQQRFVEAYQGNGTEAAMAAGYTGDANTLGVTAFHLLRNPKVRRAIRARENVVLAKLVASRRERQAFWAATMRDPGFEMKDRLKASELLGRSEADFKDKLEHSGNVTLEQLVEASVKVEGK